MANSAQSELDQAYRRASGRKRVRSSLKTGDTAVATIYETSREKPSAASTDTVLQLDRHENARTRLRGNGAASGAGNPKRREDSAETTRAKDCMRRGTKHERTRATIFAPDPTQLRESTASKRTAKSKMTGIATDRTRQRNVGATWGAALAFATLRATGQSDATVAARQRLIEDAKSRLRLAIGSQRAARANRALAAARSAPRAVTAVLRKLSLRSVKQTIVLPWRPMRPQQPGRGAPGRRETERAPAARDEIRSAMQASALRRRRLLAAQESSRGARVGPNASAQLATSGAGAAVFRNSRCNSSDKPGRGTGVAVA